MSDNKKNETSPFAGSLADKLKDLDIDTSATQTQQAEAPDPPKEPPPKESPPKEPPPKKRPEPSRQAESVDPPPEPISERDLFEKTVDELQPGDVYTGKFLGRGPELPPAPDEIDTNDAEPASETEQISEDAARESVAKRRENLQFERAVGPVDQKNKRRQKYRKQNRPAPKDHVQQITSYRSDSPDDMITPPLPKAGDGLNQVGPLEGAQKEMIARYKKRSRRHDVPEINVRGDTVDDTLRQIELFVHQQWKEKARFVRIIHGRGLQSDGDPVLKPAVLRWLEGPGYRYIKGYVPELNSVGDYGSVIAQLEPKD
jgi:DNA-nicking Smr family endonuclease